jgi:hypothetical protein
MSFAGFCGCARDREAKLRLSRRGRHLTADKVGRFVRHKRDERSILGLIEDNRAALRAVETWPDAGIPVVTLHKLLTQLAMRFTAGSTLKHSS